MKANNKGITRREFIKKTGTVTAVLGTAVAAPLLGGIGCSPKKEFILIGHPNPSTGPLSGFGEASPWADERAIEAINKEGGIYIREYGKKLPIRLRMVDTESDSSKAADLAAKLILNDKVDLMVALHTPDTVNPVDAMCERYQVPCISLDSPVEPWLEGGPYNWSFHSFWKVGSAANLFASMWNKFAGQTSKVVGGFWPNDPDGVAWATVLKEKLPELGYRVVDPGRFPYINKDFSSFITLFKKEKVDIITGCLIPPDWATLWKQCHQQGYIPKIATIAKACLFPTDVEAIGGDLAQGLTTEIWWSPNHPFKSSLTGESSSEFCNAWTAETGKQWTQPIGFKYAAFEIAFDALKRAQSIDKEKIRQAIAATDMDTLVGHIKYNNENYSETPLVGGQWVKGKKWPWDLEIIYNEDHSYIKKTAEMIFPLPA